jgi:hypothetical protein
VVAAVPGPVSASIASRLAARARQRGSVLVPLGSWTGADVTLQVMHGAWDGLGAGHGRLRRRQVVVTARGRGAAARPREITLWMPGMSAMPPIDPPPTATGPDPDQTGDIRTTPAEQDAPVIPIRALAGDAGSGGWGVEAGGTRASGGGGAIPAAAAGDADERAGDGEGAANVVAGTTFGREGAADDSGVPEHGLDVVDLAPRLPGRDGRRRTRLTAVS